MNAAHKTLQATLDNIEPRLRLMALAKMVFDPNANELARLKVGTLQQMIRRRLVGDLQAACKLIAMELVRDSAMSEDDFLVKSRNYGGRYPVSRVSIWRWFKDTDLVKALQSLQTGVMRALGVITERLWAVIASKPGYPATFTLDSVRGPPTTTELGGDLALFA